MWPNIFQFVVIVYRSLFSVYCKRARNTNTSHMAVLFRRQLIFPISQQAIYLLYRMTGGFCKTIGFRSRSKAMSLRRKYLKHLSDATEYEVSWGHFNNRLHSRNLHKCSPCFSKFLRGIPHPTRVPVINVRVQSSIFVIILVLDSNIACKKTSVSSGDGLVIVH